VLWQSCKSSSCFIQSQLSRKLTPSTATARGRAAEKQEVQENGAVLTAGNGFILTPLSWQKMPTFRMLNGSVAGVFSSLTRRANIGGLFLGRQRVNCVTIRTSRGATEVCWVETLLSGTAHRGLGKEKWRKCRNWRDERQSKKKADRGSGEASGGGGSSLR
jgi:hypothetical protein